MILKTCIFSLKPLTIEQLTIYNTTRP
jgi:hypothetical protein